MRPPALLSRRLALWRGRPPGWSWRGSGSLAGSPAGVRKKRISGFTVAGLGIVGLLSAMALLAPVLAPYSPRAIVGRSFESPSAEHWLGTNNLGQDIASQVIWGARTSLVVAAGAAALAVLVGVLLGASAGLTGGKVDALFARMLDVLMGVPGFPLLMVVGALFGASRVVLISVIGILTWPFVARVVRTQSLSLRNRGYVKASRGMGTGRLFVLRRHVAPALGPVIVAQFVGIAGFAVFMEAGLAFFGLSDPLGVSWGRMLNVAVTQQGLYFTPIWLWWVLPAGTAIALAVLGLTFLGLGLDTQFNRRVTSRGGTT